MKKLNFLSLDLHLLSAPVPKWLGDWCFTLCSSTLEQARDKFDTVLEPWQIRDEDPTIKNPIFLSQA